MNILEQIMNFVVLDPPLPMYQYPSSSSTRFHILLRILKINIIIFNLFIERSSFKHTTAYDSIDANNNCFWNIEIGFVI